MWLSFLKKGWEKYFSPKLYFLDSKGSIPFSGMFVVVQLLSRIQLFETPWTVAYRAPLSMRIFQARILEWVAISNSRGSSWPRDQTRISFKSPALQADSLPSESPGKPYSKVFYSFWCNHKWDFFLHFPFWLFVVSALKCNQFLYIDFVPCNFTEFFLLVLTAFWWHH